MRIASTLVCSVVLACTVFLVAQNPLGTAAGQGPATISGDRLPRVSAPGIRSARGSADVRPSSTAEVPPDASVVTIDGVCDRSQTSKTKDCKTVITRAEMEGIIDVFLPGTSQALRRQFAINYARLIAATAVAQQKHLEKDPEVIRQVQTQEKVARMQVLAHALYQQIQKEAEDVPTSDIQKYYEDHLSGFDEGEVLRLSLPRVAPTKDGRPLDESAIKAKADELRERAVAGEDFEQLQRDAYTSFGIIGTAPPTKLNMVRRTNLPPDEGKVFDLQAGEVSPVLDSLGSLVVLKLVSKQSVPAADAEVEIKSLLQRARMQQELETATKTVKAQFNLQYLDLSSAPDLFPPPEEVQRAANSRTLSDERSQMMNRRGMASNARRPLRRPLR